MKFTCSVTINQPIEKVAELFANPEYLKEYQEGFIKKELISGESGQRGAVSKMYYNQGYLFAQIQPIETPVGKDTLDVNFNIIEGHVVHVNEIQIIGNTKTQEKVIRREFKIQPGDIFNSSKLERSIRDITILNYFGNIIPNVNIIEDDDKHVNLEIKVEEKSTDMANMSAGYSQRDGLIGSIGLTFNNFLL